MSAIYETINKLFNKKWIEQQLGRVKLDGYKNLNPMNLASIDLHPVIKAIAGTQMKLTISEKTLMVVALINF